ncbi:hypothetical protein [Bernardetia sp.]|uniref:hypothetical protein n=1 Tax=Bernardetia sp. TaxID=1937974 RepID=UPI0025C5FBFC|nr:hypothetical protein [Bernardetia sp.]
MDIDLYEDTKNIHLEYWSFGEEFETDNKGQILIDLAQKLIEDSDSPNLQVAININSFAGHQNFYYTLGYSQFKAWKMGDMKDENYEGLVIYVKDKDIYIKKILTILANALDKIEDIKSNQTKILKEKRHSPSNNPQYDTLLSISEKEVEKYTSTSNEKVDLLANEKIYVNEISELDYYYKDYKFHIYTTRNYSNEDAISKKETELLVVDNLLEIIGNYQNGYLVFINDSTFHYLTLYNGKTKGEYTIEGIRTARMPIYNYKYKSEPMNFLLMRVADYDTVHQVLFLPDSNLVIPNYAYDPFSKKNLEAAIKKQREKESKLKNNFEFDYQIAFYISMIIISSLIVWIWRQNKS